MNLTDIISISGMPGLYKVVGQRTNGFLASNLEDGKTKFVAVHNHTASALENISIYTDEDEGIDLPDVYQIILDKAPELDPAKALKDGEKAIWGLLKAVIPNYDTERVYLNDAKKLLRWYLILEKSGELQMDPPEENETEAPEETSKETPKEATDKKSNEEAKN